jgi:acetyl-CoA carboxylase carboxyl transferase subunit alpha
LSSSSSGLARGFGSGDIAPYRPQTTHVGVDNAKWLVVGDGIMAPFMALCLRVHGLQCDLAHHPSTSDLDRGTKENIARNFGMPHPEGYRKALRLMQYAGRLGLPLVTFIDTPGAYPGLGAEERNQSEAIARNLMVMARLPIPIVCTILGEGGSGGALAVGVGNRVLMLENAIYSVISPEGCATILFKDAASAPRAAEASRLTARDLLELGVADELVAEPPEGAQADAAATAARLKEALIRNLDMLAGRTERELVDERYARFRAFGQFTDGPAPEGKPAGS